MYAQAEIANFEKECATSNGLRCEIISLYGGHLQPIQVSSVPGRPDCVRASIRGSLLWWRPDDQPLEIPHHFPFSRSGAKDRQLVGLIVDGNIHSPGGNYGFDESVNRAVSVYSGAILEALDRIYDANRVLATRAATIV